MLEKMLCFGVKDNGDVIGINYGEGTDLLSDQNNIPIKTIRFQGKDKVVMLDKMKWCNQSLLKTFKDLMSYLKLYNISRVDFS